MKRIISLLAALSLIFILAFPVFAEPVDVDDPPIAISDEDDSWEDDDELWEDEEITGTLSNDSYLFTSDPVGVEDGSVIEFNRDNYVVDFANTFTDSEKDELFEKIKEIRSKHKFDVVILTTKTMNGKNAEAYSDDFFDFNGYGYGKDRDGLIMMLCLAGGEGNRDVHISGRGSVGRKVFNSYYVLDFDNGPIFKAILPSLKDNKFFEAEKKFLERVDVHLNQYESDLENGVDRDYDESDKKLFLTPVDILKREAIVVAIACVFAYLIVKKLKSKMQTNRIQTTAASYERPGSMRIVDSRENFVRRTVSQTKIERSSDSGSSSGDHTSSSGASHSGGGGKF